MQVDFYHLVGVPLERVLPRLAEKAAGVGRVLLFAGEEGLLDRLDRLLWDYARAGFLPHAKAGGGPADTLQPILLSTVTEAANGATLLIIADGHWPGLVPGFERILYLFDEGTLAEARAAWKSLDGGNRRYWKQDDRGRWVEGP